MKIYKKSFQKNDYLVTLVIGDKYIKNWEEYCKPLWMEYCNNHDLGLIVINKNLISKKNKYYKKITWQKYLIGEYLQSKNLKINNICYLDSDILINYNSPNIFKFHKINKISVVYQYRNAPYNIKKTKEKIAVLRNRYYSNSYPIDSALHMNIKQLYEYHNLAVQKDFFCAGVFVFNLKIFSKFFKKLYFKYDKNVKSITDDGDQTHFNYEIHKLGKLNYLNYKFQALWIYEMANYYPFLYDRKNINPRIETRCISASLVNNYFLHFAGSWYESKMWQKKNILTNSFTKYYMADLKKIKKMKLKGIPRGVKKP